MGDSSPIDLRRRYARPGEFEVPSSVLESNAFKQRLGGQLNSDRTNPAPPSRQLTAGEVSNPVRRDPAPPASEARVGADRDQQLRNAVPLSREVRGGESHLRRNPAPVRNDARFAADAQQHPRSAVPVSRQLPRDGESHLRRDLAPARPVRNDARFAVDAPQYRRNPAPLATRDAIAKRRTAARFELLPDPEPRWNRIGVSAAAQLAFLGLLLLSPMIFPQQMQTALKYDVTEILQPVTHIEIPHPTPPPPPPKVKPKVQPKPIVPKPKPVEVQPPQLNPKQPHVFLVLKPQLPKVHVVEAKPVDLKPIFAQAEIVLTSNQPKRPKEVLKAPILQPMRKEDIQAPGLGFGLPATVVAAASKVQTGGFGDPHGIHGPANPSKAANVNQAGSPNLPGGPGYGNGTGGAQGARGTLASDGSKGNGTGTSGAGTGGTTSGVAILSKPNPSYSIEARTIKLEGDVVLEVVFLASGQVQVIRVVSGLGHGLDEAALQAAKLIRFRPALRNGQPVDFHAHVRIEFRLAN